MRNRAADRLVIFGITGVLAKVTWRVMEPLLAAPPRVHTYVRGSWGPPQADDPVARHRRPERWATS